jgi:hypothetical protein
MSLKITSSAEARALQARHQEKLLAYAFHKEHWKAASMLIEQGTNPETPISQDDLQGYGAGVFMCISSGMCRPLHYIASREDSSNLIRRLVAKKADINARDTLTNITPLHIACAHTQIQNILTLLELGADPTISDWNQRSPLHMFGGLLFHLTGDEETKISKMAEEVIKSFVKSGANVNARDRNGMTPLHHCFKSPAMVLPLLMSGANPGITWTAQWTSFHEACGNNPRGPSTKTSEIVALMCESILDGLSIVDETVADELKKQEQVRVAKALKERVLQELKQLKR